jgi:ArsR family transcriptional regulator
MTRNRYEESLEARADLFKALGHPARLLIVNLMKIKPRHGEELAAILKLKPATISHHLAKLARAGLLSSRKHQYYQVYSLVPAMLEKTIGELTSPAEPGPGIGAREDAYREKVFRTFFRHGRLVSIPAQLKKRQIILERLVEEFEPERDYTENEVNRTLVEFHEDVASLRREMISFKLMTRSRGIYRRL